MDDIMGLVFVVIAIVSAISKANKSKTKAENARQKHIQQTYRSAAPKPAAPAAPAVPAAPDAKQISMAAMLPPREGSSNPVMQPQVHVHLEPACDTHDAPGSLGVTSTEGKDACHEEQMSSMRASTIPAASQESRPALALDWTSDSLVKAVVMQEVLTRPSQRQARR